MKTTKYLPALVVVLLLAVVTINIYPKLITENKITGAPPYGESESEVPDENYLSNRSNWVRPEGPVRVGLQVGHWKSNELPVELERLRNNTGATGRGIPEWEVNFEIAKATEQILIKKNIVVDIIPATVPPAYLADAFIAIHADGSENTGVSGYKVAAPWRDWNGKSTSLAKIVGTSYEKSTNLVEDPNITRNMRGYYAFSWWRFNHAVHPMTPSIILETGFLTNYSDQLLIIDQPEISAEGLANGIIEFLELQKLI